MNITRRVFLKGTAAAAVFIPAVRLMNVWTPAEPEIFTGYGTPEIITDPNAYNFSMSGLAPGSHVMVMNEFTKQVLIDTVVQTSAHRWNIPGDAGGAPLNIITRHPNYKDRIWRVGSPYPDGKTKIKGFQLQEGIIHA